MFRLAFRLETHGRIGINLITRALLLHTGRRPVRILNDDEEKPPVESRTEQNRPNKKKLKSSDVYRQSKFDGQFYIKSEVNKDLDEPDTEADSDGKPRLPWNEEKNDYKLSQYMVTVKSRNKRRKENITLLEGIRLISDALLAGVKLRALFLSRRSDIHSIPLPAYGYELYWVPYKYFKKWSDVTTSSGVMAIVKIPSTKETAPDPNCLPLTVICDNIREPGNMGAILRVLAAVGCRKILITNGCVDIWEPKVLRAAAGGHFRVPIEYDVNWEDVNSLLGDETSYVYLADSRDKSSSNVAEMSDTKSSDSEDIGTHISEQNNTCLQREDTQETQNTTGNNQEILQALPYHNVQFHNDGSNILVISNESFGPSNEALAFTLARQGVKIHIPLYGKVESLNVVSALSVIAFEMRRQMSLC